MGVDGSQYDRTHVRIDRGGGIGFEPHASHDVPVHPRADISAGEGLHPACGASRFAFNQSLHLVADALAARKRDPPVMVPWSGFDLINAFNHWKTSESAGRVFTVAPDGTTTKQVTGLSWRKEVSAQVFEEAAVDLGRGLGSARPEPWSDRLPRPKRKGRHRESFRLRNRETLAAAMQSAWGKLIPVVTLSRIGTIGCRRRSAAAADASSC